MPRKHSSSRDGRGKIAFGARAQQQNRTRIAQLAAEFILEHGLDDWLYAKRKAARQLLLPENSALPGDEEIETALFERQKLFGDKQTKPHAETLKEKRLLALRWMERLSAFSPMLYGALAEGWGGAHQAIRLELVSDDSKAVEIRLIDLGFSCQPEPGTQPDLLKLRFYDGDHEIRLRIISTTARRNNKKSGKALLNHNALCSLLDV